MAAFLNLLGKSKPAKLTWFYRRAPNAAGGLYLWCQDDLPNTFVWVMSIHPYIHPVNGSGESFSTCVLDHSQINQYSSRVVTSTCPRSPSLLSPCSGTVLKWGYVWLWGIAPSLRWMWAGGNLPLLLNIVVANWSNSHCFRFCIFSLISGYGGVLG